MVLSVTVGSVSLVGSATGSTLQQQGEENETATVVGFEANNYNASRGDIAEINVELPGVSTAYVTINSDETNYNPTLRVSDGNLDGQVTVLLNTYATPQGPGPSFGVGNNADTVEYVGGNANTTEPLPTGQYDLAVRPDEGGDVADTANFELTYGGPTSFGTLTASGQYNLSDFNTRDEVYNRSSATSSIAQGDLVVHRLGGSGITGAIIANQGEGESLEKAFLDFLNARQGNDDVALLTVSRARTGETLPLTEDNFKLVVSSTRSVVFIIIDTDDLQLNNQYNVRFAVSSASGIVDRTAGVSTSFRVVPRTAEFNTEMENGQETAITYADPGASLSGSTTVAPGSELRVTADDVDLDETVTVDEDRNWGTTFDLTGVEAGSEFTATVSGSGVEETSVPALVREGRRASIDFSDQSSDGQNVTVDEVNLSTGGYVVIHDETYQNGEEISSVRGVSEYLRPGVHEDVEISLERPFEQGGDITAMAHLDTNENQEFDYVSSEGEQDTPYVVDDNPVSSGATLSVDGSGGGSDEFGPGFGAVAAIVALLAGGLIALRRD
ncbi:DUF7282 domain-containing protein [Halomarina ordinaria]|nr:BGTF surface domain-containing protein [Halomarina sp. PSRA2]